MTFSIRAIQAFCYRYPLSTPVVTSFGRMLNRPAVFVRAEDEDGVVGWGEAWSNFPSTGAEHRARLVNEVLGPALTGSAFENPAQAFEILTQGTAVLALQCGEPGPFAQAIAGIDLALWDLHARRHSKPLWRLLGGKSGTIKAYASGINPGGAQQTAEAALKRGHRAMKLKVGFDNATDLANLAALRAVVGDGMLAADANQGWSIDQALQTVPRLGEFGLRWLEEPLRADRPRQEWRSLREIAPMPLAAGENIASREDFAQASSRKTCSMSCSLTSPNGAGCRCAADWRTTSSKRAKPSARIISAAASACWRLRICWRAAAETVGSKSTSTTTRCATGSADRSSSCPMALLP